MDAFRKYTPAAAGRDRIEGSKWRCRTRKEVSAMAVSMGGEEMMQS